MKIALVGNQNSGKTTLFNTLTGMNAKIGNWPGVTIEKKVGKIKKTEHELVDLPGIYSLSPYSVEEEISRKFIFEEKPDVIINIVDSTSLERSLYLTTQLLELDCKVIVALNMTDILEKKGISINETKLEKELSTKVIKISALKGTGIKELLIELEKKKKYDNIQIYDGELENTIKKVSNLLSKETINKRFVSVNLLERDERFEYLNNFSINELVKELSDKYKDDLEEIIATQRYSFIENVKKFSVIEKQIKETGTDRIDKILLNKWLAFPIFIAIMFLIYYLSVGIIGSYTVDWVASIVETFGKMLGTFLSNIGASEWVNSLVIDGIVSGVGAVLGFVPQLIILFICISVLETTGYMSRIALLLDKLFRKIGLSGKSLIPFIIGSGCSVPGIMGTRIIENQDEREMTAILTPFIPCSAKLPIIALFAGYFFKDYAGFASASLYFFSIIIIIFSAILMKKIVFKNTSSTYISELPDYKLPNAKYVSKDVFEKISSFIKRAGSVILICSIIIWFLLSFSFKLEYGVAIEESMLASIGKTISWIFKPMLGENSWGAAVSAIQGLVAKEQVISSMSVIAGLAEGTEEGNKIFGEGSIFSFFTTASAYAFMVFNLFSAPCFGAIGAMKRELGGNKKMLKAVIFQTIVAWILATITYQIGSRVEKGIITIADILIIGAILIGVFTIIAEIIRKRKNGEECIGCPYSRECNKK
ncbi:MAG: ferrous iron transport protein B [Clostridiales bacterium]|nr:ferrous iron transport protein B [Clostridiales bacterium]